jgi:hypothetical protein
MRLLSPSAEFVKCGHGGMTAKDSAPAARWMIRVEAPDGCAATIFYFFDASAGDFGV